MKRWKRIVMRSCHGPFSIELYPRGVDSGEIEKRIPPHKLVLEPLLNVANEVTVHGRRRAPALAIPSGVRKGSTLYLDLTREVPKGWETFWNAGNWDRGAILITVPRPRVDWPTLFSWTQYVGVPVARTQILKSTPPAAIAYAEAAARDAAVVVSLSASNGIQYADVWSDPATCRELEDLAREHCRRFVRWVEHGKYERELVYDRPPYVTLV